MQHVIVLSGLVHIFLLQFAGSSEKLQFFQNLSLDEKSIFDNSSQQTFLGQKKTVSLVVASKSKCTVKETSPKYLKLSWKEIISLLLKQ